MNRNVKMLSKRVYSPSLTNVGWIEDAQLIFLIFGKFVLIFFPRPALSTLACVASVSVGFGSKERPRNGVFRYFACAENGARAKNRTVGVGEGKEGTACGQTPGF